jgi:hypothetical protein
MASPWAQKPPANQDVEDILKASETWSNRGNPLDPSTRLVHYNTQMLALVVAELRKR